MWRFVCCTRDHPNVSENYPSKKIDQASKEKLKINRGAPRLGISKEVCKAFRYSVEVWWTVYCLFYPFYSILSVCLEPNHLSTSSYVSPFLSPPLPNMLLCFFCVCVWCAVGLKPLTVPFMAAAVGTGVLEAYVYCPLEVIKTRMQVKALKKAPFGARSSQRPRHP